MPLHYRTNDSGRWRIYLGLNTVTENDALVQFVQPGNRKKSSTNVFSFRDCMSSVYFVVWCKWNLLLEIRNVVVVGSNQVVGSKKLEWPAARARPWAFKFPRLCASRSLPDGDCLSFFLSLLLVVVPHNSRVDAFLRSITQAFPNIRP